MSNSLYAATQHLTGRISPRQARLFLCACVRRMERAGRGSYREVVELAERYADGLATDEELSSMRVTYRFRFLHPGSILLWPIQDEPAGAVQRGLVWLSAIDDSDAEQRARHDLLYDICGEAPGAERPAAAWLRWQDGTIPRMAEVIARERAFDQLPVLADALEEAGCPPGRLLRHCRAWPHHAYGCWAVEQLRGRG